MSYSSIGPSWIGRTIARWMLDLHFPFRHGHPYYIVYEDGHTIRPRTINLDEAMERLHQ